MELDGLNAGRKGLYWYKTSSPRYEILLFHVATEQDTSGSLQYRPAKSSATICGKKVFRKARDHFCGRSFLRESFAEADQRTFQQSFLREFFLQSRAIISAGFSFAMPEHEKLKWKTSL